MGLAPCGGREEGLGQIRELGPNARPRACGIRYLGRGGKDVGGLPRGGGLVRPVHFPLDTLPFRWRSFTVTYR